MLRRAVIPIDFHWTDLMRILKLDNKLPGRRKSISEPKRKEGESSPAVKKAIKEKVTKSLKRKLFKRAS